MFGPSYRRLRIFFILNYANRFVAQIKYQAVKLNLEPLWKHLQVTSVGPGGFVRTPSFQLFFEKNFIAGFEKLFLIRIFPDLRDQISG